jgi:hypothetical protein
MLLSDVLRQAPHLFSQQKINAVEKMVYCLDQLPPSFQAAQVPRPLPIPDTPALHRMNHPSAACHAWQDPTNGCILAAQVAHLPQPSLHLDSPCCLAWPGAHTTRANDCTAAQVVYLSKNLLHSLRGIEVNFRAAKVLSLADNLLPDFLSLEPLAEHCPLLEALSLEGNPCTKLPHYRARVLHMLPHLKVLDGRAITGDERRASAAALERDAAVMSVMLSNACLVHKLVCCPPARSMFARLRQSGLIAPLTCTTHKGSRQHVSCRHWSQISTVRQQRCSQDPCRRCSQALITLELATMLFAQRLLSLDTSTAHKWAGTHTLNRLAPRPTRGRSSLLTSDHLALHRLPPAVGPLGRGCTQHGGGCRALQAVTSQLLALHMELQRTVFHGHHADRLRGCLPVGAVLDAQKLLKLWDYEHHLSHTVLPATRHQLTPAPQHARLFHCMAWQHYIP